MSAPGYKRTFSGQLANVRFTPESGHNLGPVYLGSFCNRVAGTPLIGPGVRVPTMEPGVSSLVSGPGHMGTSYGNLAPASELPGLGTLATAPGRGLRVYRP